MHHNNNKHCNLSLSLTLCVAEAGPPSVPFQHTHALLLSPFLVHTNAHAHAHTVTAARCSLTLLLSLTHCFCLALATVHSIWGRSFFVSQRRLVILLGSLPLSLSLMVFPFLSFILFILSFFLPFVVCLLWLHTLSTFLAPSHTHTLSLGCSGWAGVSGGGGIDVVGFLMSCYLCVW